MAEYNLLAGLGTLAGAVGIRDLPAAADQRGIPALVMRGDSDTIGTADGDLSMIRVDEEGRVKVATKPGSVPRAAGTLTSTAAAPSGLTGGAVSGGNGAIAYPVGRVSNLMIHVRNTGTVPLAAGTFVWEGSIDSTNGADGTWFGLQAVRSNANTIELQIAPATLAVGAGYAAAWELSVNGLAWVRIRCTVNPTTNAAATWTIQPGTYATEPIPAAQTHAISGSVTATPAAATAYKLTTAATTNAAVVKASAGRLAILNVSNPTTTAANLKLYDKATAPTVGTDVPTNTIPIPAGTAAQAVRVSEEYGAHGLQFASGIGIAVTANAAATDTTATVAGIQIHASYV